MYVYNNTSTKEHFGCHAKEKFMRQKSHLHMGMVALDQFSFQEHVSANFIFCCVNRS